MSKIACSVDKCSHNKSGCCCANFVEIDGNHATNDADTCCTSYLNKQNYSCLTNACMDNSAECECLNCHVESCKYNENCCAIVMELQWLEKMRLRIVKQTARLLKTNK